MMMEASPTKSVSSGSSDGDYQNLEEAVAFRVDAAPPVAHACIEIVAPIALPGNYPLDVEVNGQILTVLVPKGGVQEGQLFTGLGFPKGLAKPKLEIPVGGWRDGLCDCCVHGCCHGLLCMAIWCAPVALGHVMTRMKLNWHGSGVGGNPGTMSTFKTVLFIWLLFLLVDHGLSVVYNSYLTPLWRRDGNDTVIPPLLYFIWMVRISCHMVFFMYLIVATMKTREFIRNKYSIPEQNCAGCEDCCCSFWCSCCTITQMARHTADYDTYRSTACTDTGLPHNTPEII